MMRRLKTIVGYVCLGLLSLSVGCSAAAHYRRHHDPESLFKVMHESVRAGDSLEQVHKLLGPGQEADQRSREAVRKLARKCPDKYPDGVTEGDQILVWPMGQDAAMQLAFRDGKLLNHNPSDYAVYEPMISAVASTPAP